MGNKRLPDKLYRSGAFCESLGYIVHVILGQSTFNNPRSTFQFFKLERGSDHVTTRLCGFSTSERSSLQYVFMDIIRVRYRVNKYS